MKLPNEAEGSKAVLFSGAASRDLGLDVSLVTHALGIDIAANTAIWHLSLYTSDPSTKQRKVWRKQ